MNRSQLIKPLLDITTGVVELKRLHMRRSLRRTFSKAIHTKQANGIERDMQAALVVFFKNQIKDVSQRLSQLHSDKAYNKAANQNQSETAGQLSSQAYNPREWDTKLQDAIGPVMIRYMGEAALGQLAVLGVDLQKAWGFKATTASEWIANLDPEDLADIVFESGLGQLPMRFATEWPPWLKLAIRNLLKTSFAQPYWKQINNTTSKDITKYLHQGLQEGWSIRQMASSIRDAGGLGFEYYKRRSENIARTESGHALNGARDASYQQFKEEMGEAGQHVGKVWLSVLSNTTRDAHADLDGEPADKNGMWNLNGVMIPWPGHINLPPSDRCNCFCTITTEFGLGAPETEIQSIMDELENRGAWLMEKYNPNQPRVPAGSSSGGQFGRASGMVGTVRGGDGKLQLANGEPLPKHIPKNIPPAWRDVMVNPDPKADCLVLGVDKKGRTQSVYSDDYRTRKAAKKFARVEELRKKNKSIGKELRADMKSKTPKVKEAASCLLLIQQTGIRPGSSTDTKGDKKAYGATTLEGRHVRVSSKGKVSLNFTGKKGVKIKVPVEDTQTAKMLVSRKKKAGNKGKLFNTNASALRSYSRRKDGGGFKPKDFRTAKGTEIAVQKVKGMSKPKTTREYKRQVREVAKAVSNQLGNTPSVALQSYINPAVFSGWRV